ncbi:hypothetical protein V474_08695 [Novosphingobium barchaimii LL02]|uniref:Uncharacterized protein n=1 Tax=Novosphingobium barchaimii LL02 TaxID=1114963 RepID=A0A0J7Y7H5_9SPHN|nr:hypothetical protein [Novosphingobium barchaimii]KMS59283.1 hypothetical protein V474_08695 [Novosphingobium barchaimii LL02]
MIDQAAPPATSESVEAALRAELARADAMAGTAAPILRHLVAARDIPVFSEEMLARIRAMLASLAGELLDALIGADGRRAHSPAEVEVLGGALLDNPALLAHLHGLAQEWQLTERLQARLALDPVASPMLRSLIHGPDGAPKELAMAFLAAQARWCQAQRRMELPLGELPADLLNVALYTLRTLAGIEPALAERAGVVEGKVRQTYDENATRIGLAERLVKSLGDGVHAALRVDNAGAALFLTALALGSRQQRDAAVHSTHDTQMARLALGLRASGLGAVAVEEQFLALHPEVTLPAGFERLDAERAAMLLSSPVGYRS